MKRRSVFLALLLTVLLLTLPAFASGGSADDPVEVPESALVVRSGVLYGIDETWFAQQNPEKGVLYVAVSVPSSVTKIAFNGLNNAYTSEKAQYGALQAYDKLGSFALARLDFSQAVNLTEIEKQAVKDASGLTGVLDLSATRLTTIGKLAFSGCSGLTGVIVPDTLVRLGDSDGSGSVFSECRQLQFIRLAGSAETTLFELPDSLKYIGRQTFKNCFAAGLDVRVVIPAGVETIGSEAFRTDRISQIVVKRQGDAWTSNYGGYDSGAFKTGRAGLLVIFNDAASYQDYKLNRSPQSAVRSAMCHPITVTFEGAGVSEEKLNYQSVRYVRASGTDFWVLDESYTLPSLAGTPAEKPGYDISWTIGGTPLTDTSKLSTNQTSPKATVSYSLQNPTVEYAVGGVSQSGSALTVEFDGLSASAHTAGVNVSHPLLLSEQGSTDEYVYFSYCWWDEADDSPNGPRSEAEPQLFSSSHNGVPVRVQTQQSFIPIESAAHERANGDQYMVEIYGYIVQSGGAPRLFYKSHHNFIDFGSDSDTEATVPQSYVFTVSVKQLEPVEVTPADLTIYSGGNGYTGTVGADGTLLGTAESGFPEPGFYITLPDDADAALKAELSVGADETVDLSPYVTFSSGDKVWTLELYGSEGASVFDGKYLYRLVAGSGQTPVRMQFTDTGGTVQVSDRFSLSNALHSRYIMSIYPGAVQQQNVAVTVRAGNLTMRRAVRSAPGELTIRGVTAEGASGAVLSSAPEAAVSQITAVVPDDTQYYVNDSGVLVVGGLPSLLADSVVHTQNSGTLLAKKALAVLPENTFDNPQFDFRYLDLVDAANGNTWLSAKAADGSAQEITVYWPYPEGAGAQSVFRLVHFEGLNREMSAADVGSEIAECTAVPVAVENTGLGIRFTTDSFSPFALIWDAPEQTASENLKTGTAPQTGDAAHPAAPAVAAAVCACAAVLLLKKRVRNS